MSENTIIEAVEEVAVEEETFAYELRGLQASDLGAICKIIQAIGFKEFKICFENPEIIKAIHKMEKDNKDNKDKAISGIETIGLGVMFDIVGIITANIPKAEAEIQAFVGSVAGLDIKEVKAIPLADYGELIMRIVMLKDFRDFFMRAYKLFK